MQNIKDIQNELRGSAFSQLKIELEEIYAQLQWLDCEKNETWKQFIKALNFKIKKLYDIDNCNSRRQDSISRVAYLKSFFVIMAIVSLWYISHSNQIIENLAREFNLKTWIMQHSSTQTLRATVYIQNLLDADLLKQENIDGKIVIQRLQERIRVLEKDNSHVRGKWKDLKAKHKKLEADNKLDKDNYSEDITKLLQEKTDLSLEVKQLRELIRDMEDKYRRDMEEIQQDHMTQITLLEKEKKALEDDLDNVQAFKSQQKQLDAELSELKDLLEKEKKDRMNEVNEKEREKIQATEKLRKDMLYKIKETKANLLALNDEQLQTTTRLTILQNHQLTTELEYQSKQTEQLLYKNNKMKQQIETLKRDIEIHKEVEKELAKRSHFCQKVIKRLKQQVKELEQEKEETQNRKAGTMPKQNMRNSMVGSPKKNKDSSIEDSKANEDLINFLEHKLEEIEKKLANSQSDYEVLQNDYMELQEKMNLSREKHKRAALLLTDFLDDLLNDNPNILQSDKDMHLNLDKIKETPIEQLDKEDKIALVLVILKQLQPYLSANNLSVAPPKTNMRPQPSQSYTGKRTGGNPHDMMTASGAGEVEHLNKMLNNINVQTKKNEHGDKLPPIKRI
ncbi:UNKNOWN [Stylonychia lemnae]|uniref:Cilia- and flagella-associated protein 157 n=1 Tax=Stylonychia lemnae TaxID=5949 RepID=A0A078A928_STYLE|nr:UNKNOWN [Stylonychia lemnae]|eukprot:CDW78724.1 UNKNOWN [Stylonychia lemnae]